MLSWVLMLSTFYFFYQHPECFVSADETLTLCYISWRILDVYLESFQLLKTRFIFWSFKTSVKESDTSLIRFGGACSAPHWKCSIWNAWSLFSFWSFCFFPFFLHISPTEWFYWRENDLKPTTNMLNVYILYISALVWLVFAVGFTGNTGTFFLTRCF